MAWSIIWRESFRVKDDGRAAGAETERRRMGVEDDRLKVGR